MPPARQSIILPRRPLLTRFSYALQTYIFQFLSKPLFNLFYYLCSSHKYSSTLIKRYPIRPLLECRIFIPSSYQPSDLHPLYIDIHGGGFFAGTASMDDKYCHYLCNKLSVIVISLSYSLAPQHPFPTAINDITALISSILEDTSLPITKQLAIGGQSAGGTLALSVAQDPQLKEKIAAVVAFYPATDFSWRFTGEFRDKPTPKGVEKDGLRTVFPLAGWSYVPEGQDRGDARLSPVYAERSQLPGRIYFVAAEFDVLTTEAFAMARRLAGDDEVREDEVWEREGVRWECLKGETHGFVEEGWGREFWKKERMGWKKETEEVLERVEVWLKERFEEWDGKKL